MISCKLDKHFKWQKDPLAKQKLADLLCMIDPKYVEDFLTFRDDLLATLWEEKEICV